MFLISYLQSYPDKSLKTIIWKRLWNPESSSWNGCRAYQYDWWVFNLETAHFEPLCSELRPLDIMCEGSHNPTLSCAEEFHRHCSINMRLLDHQFNQIIDKRIRQNHSDIYMNTRVLLNLFIQVTRKTTAKESLGIPTSKGLSFHSDDRWCMISSWNHLSFSPLSIRFWDFSLETWGWNT